MRDRLFLRCCYAVFNNPFVCATLVCCCCCYCFCYRAEITSYLHIYLSYLHTYISYLRTANRPWSVPPRLEVKAIQSAPAGYTANLAAKALSFVQQPPTGRSWSERVANGSGGHGKPTTVNPPADKAALSKFISDEITKQCNNTTLQNTKTMLCNTTVVDKLQLDMVKMKKKEVSL